MCIWYTEQGLCPGRFMLIRIGCVPRYGFTPNESVWLVPGTEEGYDECLV
jgi:hypothetical protein